MKWTFGHGQINPNGAVYRDADSISPVELVNCLRARCEPDAVVDTPSGTLHVWSIFGRLCGYVLLTGGTEVVNRYLYSNTVSADAMASDILSQLRRGDLETIAIIGADFITLSEYAALHGVTPQTIRDRIKRGLHPEATKPARDWMFPKDAPYRPDGRKKPRE